MGEIGSEFWTRHNPVSLRRADNEAYLLSGRTALRFIIDDICKSRKFRKVLLPAYCCESMIEPFVALGIDTQFYPTYVDHMDFPYENDADAILLIDFFGYTNHQNREIAKSERQAGKIVIYDSTHKIDGNSSVMEYADYSFCSYRKWFYCNFAKVIKKDGVFDCSELRTNERYIALRDKAAQAKDGYFAGITGDKEKFLSLFSAAEQMLDEDYAGYAGEPAVFDIQEITLKRRENAAYLIRELKKIPGIALWRDAVGADDVPMFVPILVDVHIRDDLRRSLIKEKIYCPVHWTKSAYHGECNEIYDMELSLVCDQRYDIADMERMVRVINGYFNR